MNNHIAQPKLHTTDVFMTAAVGLSAKDGVRTNQAG